MLLYFAGSRHFCSSIVVLRIVHGCDFLAFCMYFAVFCGRFTCILPCFEVFCMHFGDVLLCSSVFYHASYVFCGGLVCFGS